MDGTATRTLFGTDGIRGKTNRPPLDPDTLVAIGAVFGKLVHESRGPRDPDAVLLGHDGRLSSSMIEAALSAGLMGQGLDTFGCGLVTTPALAHETRLGGFAAGIMISASHNPADDNGIKIFGGDGRKLADELEQRIEQDLQTQPISAEGRVPGRARRMERGADNYRSFLRDAFPSLRLDGLRLLVDCAHGGGSRLAPEVLTSFGAAVNACNDAPDGTNINDECGALHARYIAAAVRERSCDLGVCLDGDGDRAVFIDERGKVVHGDALLTLLAIHLGEHGRLPGNAVAVTVMSNLGLARALSARGIDVVETPVGDRSVMAAMQEHGLALGGENSGHVIFGERHNYTGDGIFTCLELVSLMQRSGRPLSDLAACFQAYPQQLVNVPVTDKPDLGSLPLVQKALTEVEAKLGGDGRVVLRYSGTEDLCRVMVEARTRELVAESAAALVAAVKRSLGA